MRTPDALVLGAGGILGEAWMSAVLAGLEESSDLDLRRCDCYVGTSAGSIVAVALAAGIRPAARVGNLPEQPEPTAADGPSLLGRVVGSAAGVWSVAAGPLAPLALRTAAPGGALLRRVALARVPPGRMSLAELRRRIDALGASWDGRLRIAAVEVETGRRVVFGSPEAPAASVAEAVHASCAIPGVFRPLLKDGRTYVDGGAWSPTNMDAAEVGRGARVLCLNPTGSMLPTVAEPAGAIGPLSRSLAATEALALRRRGARVTTINPDRASVTAMGRNLMDAGPRRAVIAAGVAQGRALAQRLAPSRVRG